MEPTQSNEAKQKQAATQEQAEDNKKNTKASRQKQPKEKKPIRRIFPIWLRIVVVFVLAFLALIIGLVVGYSILGDGSPMDVLELETWQHIIDIATGGS